MNVLQLVLLLGILYCLLCIGTMLFILLNKVIVLLTKLDKPTREEIIGHLSTAEAQKERLRILNIQQTRDENLAIMIANNLGKVLGGNK